MRNTKNERYQHLPLLRKRQMRLPALPRRRMQVPLLCKRQLPLPRKLPQLRLLLNPAAAQNRA